MSVHLFDPLTIRGVTFPHRIWVSPMCQYSAVDGVVGQWHHVHLGSLISGGAGMVMVEATAVSPEGRISIACPGIWNEAQISAWKPIVQFSHEFGVPIGIQLAHAGRKASMNIPWVSTAQLAPSEGGWETVAPSALAFGEHAVPRSMSIPEIKALIQDFVLAARHSVAAGFDLIEIHAAHGYLLHEFLSPLSNERVDEYGGSLENRARLLLEISAAIRSEVGESVPLFVRISATDWVEDGWEINQSIALAKLLKERGVDLIDVSSGGLVSYAHIKPSPGYQVPFAAQIRAAAKVATSAVGLITRSDQAEEIVSSGKADAVMLARQLLRNPRWPLQAASELGVELVWPHQIARGRS